MFGQQLCTREEKEYISDAANEDVWEKYVFISALAGMTCLCRSNVGAISSTSEGRDLMLRLAYECMTAAKHAGHPMRPHALQEITSRLTDVDSKLTSSMFRDMLSGGRIESDHLVGDMLARLRQGDAKADAVMLQAALCHLQCYNIARSAKL